MIRELVAFFIEQSLDSLPQILDDDQVLVIVICALFKILDVVLHGSLHTFVVVKGLRHILILELQLRKGQAGLFYSGLQPLILGLEAVIGLGKLNNLASMLTYNKIMRIIKTNMPGYVALFLYKTLFEKGEIVWKCLVRIKMHAILFVVANTAHLHRYNDMACFKGPLTS